jgi:hypothetical protein
MEAESAPSACRIVAVMGTRIEFWPHLPTYDANGDFLGSSIFIAFLWRILPYVSTGFLNGHLMRYGCHISSLFLSLPHVLSPAIHMVVLTNLIALNMSFAPCPLAQKHPMRISRIKIGGPFCRMHRLRKGSDTLHVLWLQVPVRTYISCSGHDGTK